MITILSDGRGISEGISHEGRSILFSRTVYAFKLFSDDGSKYPGIVVG